MARPTFMSFGYITDPLDNYNETSVLSSLRDSLPVYARGDDVLSGSGHAWVIDGHAIYRNTSCYYHMYSPYSLYKAITEYHTYVHCNWGWGGNNNCYCLEDSFVIYGDRMTEKNNFDGIKIISNIHY